MKIEEKKNRKIQQISCTCIHVILIGSVCYLLIYIIINLYPSLSISLSLDVCLRSCI